jgi:SPP1 gp7 family putative phage head morphogenesis protein
MNPRYKAIVSQLNRRRKIGRLKGRAVRPSQALIVEYTRDLKRLVDFVYNQWIGDLENSIPSYWRFMDSDETEAVKIVEKNLATYLKAVAAMQVEIVTKYVKDGNAFNRRHFIKSIKKAIGIDITKILTEKGVATELNQAIIWNTRLIKAIGNDLNHDLQTAVQTAVRKGLKNKDDFYSLQKELLRIKGMGYNRSLLIATDQLGKLNGALNKIRQTNIGIRSYIWVDADDSRVRPLHRKYDGNQYYWDDPPSDGHPGEAVRCRCEAIPNVEEFLKDVAV